MKVRKHQFSMVKKKSCKLLLQKHRSVTVTSTINKKPTLMIYDGR